MAYYLSQFTGDGSELNPFRPPVDGSWGIIDLRGDSTVQAGRCLLWTPADLPTDPRYEKVADETVESIPRPISQRIENTLGVTLDQFDTLQAIIAELLILHGSFTDPGRWNPLKANRFGRHVIHLGGKIYDAPAPQGAVFTDDFNRADQDLVDGSSDWAELEAVSSWNGHSLEIVSNEVVNTAAAESDAMHVTDFTTDHYTQAVFSASGDEYLGVYTRVVHGANPDAYLGYWRGSADSWRIALIDTGSFSVLVEEVGAPASLSNVVLRLESDGSAHELFADDVLVASVTDTTLSNLRTGFLIANVGTGVADNFEAGDLFSTTSLYATGDGTIVDVVNESDAASPLEPSVDDDPASPSDSDWVNNAVDVVP